MSRWIEVDEENRHVKETIASMDECKMLCNEVCCNDQSEYCACWPPSDLCGRKCPHFEKEDGIITDQ